MKQTITKTYTLEDIKQAFVDGFYDGAGDDAWYEDHDCEGYSTILKENASVQKSLRDYLDDLKRIESEQGPDEQITLTSL